MRTKALALITASILSLAACGDDDTSSTAGGSGTGGASGSGGATGTGGTSGGAAGTGGSGGGGQAGTSPGDASSPMDVRQDTPTGTNDAPADRPPSTDAPGTDAGSPGDATSDPDGQPMDASSPPDGGASDVSTTDGASGDAPADTRTDAPAGDGSSTMVLTSTAFTEGMTIPVAHTCDGLSKGVSPPFAWTPGPAGTMSYAVVLTDKTNNLVHAGIYDIPASVTSLPMNVEKVAMPSDPAGSKQIPAYSGMYGYAGPCPGPTVHTYEFMLYAVDSPALPGVTSTTNGKTLVTALQAHDLATTTLTGKASTSIPLR